MGRYLGFTVLLTILFLMGCKTDVKNKQIIVKNNMDVERSLETVSVSLKNLGFFQDRSSDSLRLMVVDINTKEQLTTQIIDSDTDGISDALLFQPNLKPLSTKVFEVIRLDDLTTTKDAIHCYSRFVPERTDDYAWENNRVAFRTFGPTAQKMVEDSVKGGTLSSGIDAWLKRVDYPIINKWYHKNETGPVSYHVDTGEGVDNFHVGVSRGVGGTAIKVDSTYYFSKNFVSWEHLNNGPLRTSFILRYKNWDAAGTMIEEVKHISLDYGSNLSKFEIKFKGTDVLSAGLTLHEKDGVIKADTQNGWVSYWQPHEDSELGMGIVAAKETMVGYEHYVTYKTDESNLYAHLKPSNDTVTYYAGFGWKKSGQFESKETWENYLSDFAKKINNPLTVTIR